MGLDNYLTQLEQLASQATTPSLTYAEKGGLYAAAQAICAAVEECAHESNIDSTYVDEKIEKFLYFLGSALGFRDDYGNSISSCVSSAEQQITGIRLQLPR